MESYDIGIITVLGVELKALKLALEITDEDEFENKGSLFWRKNIIAKDKLVSVIIHCVADQGNDATASATSRLIERFDPAMVLLMGISAGMKGKCRIGEVFVPRYTAHTGIEVQIDGELKGRPEIFRHPQEINQMLIGFDIDNDIWINNFKAIFPNSIEPKPGLEGEYAKHVAELPTLDDSALHSANILVKDPERLKQSRDNLHQQIKIGDMEAGGFTKAAKQLRPIVPWLIVRAVSDFGDEFKDDVFHLQASCAAASYVKTFIHHGYKPVLLGRKQVPAENIDNKIFNNISELSEYVGIRDMREEFVFFDREKINYHSVDSKFNDRWIEYPSHLDELFRKRIPEIKEDAERGGRTFDNNPSYQLRSVSVKRDFKDAEGNRRPKYILEIFPTDYEHFVYPNSRLSEEVYDDRIDKKISLKDYCGLKESNLRFDSLRNTNLHFKIGTGLALITSDGYLIASVRSNRQLIVPGDQKSIRLHLSTAEGMLKGDCIDGRPNPFFTAFRSLEDELGIIMGKDIVLDEIISTGFYLDRMRAQPFFSYIYTSKMLSKEDVFDRWNQCPKDRHENKYILAIRFTPENIFKIFYNQGHENVEYEVPSNDKVEFEENYKGMPFVLASNHAEIGYLSSLVEVFGFKETSFYATKVKNT
ncbi:hypothetical protein R50073_02210 [Maricurvus nonylphenolicus]|uniref:5'-methylthioadenosine/S-adenosylhomocysteine nucleosidase family protein n=1 Tax=Maricurvus nonylphenolicus TaxID=1008307 RepID=UPI0036F19502